MKHGQKVSNALSVNCVRSTACRLIANRAALTLFNHDTFRAQVATNAKNIRHLSSQAKKKERDQYLTDLFEQMVTQQHAQHDVHQLAALKELDRLRNDLLELQTQGVPTSYPHVEKNPSFRLDLEDISMLGSGEEDEIKDGKQLHIGAALAKKREASRTEKQQGFWSTFFESFQKEGKKFATKAIIRTKHPVSSVKGVYLHGGVGCGKTFCMDLFYHSILGTKSSLHSTLDVSESLDLMTGSGIKSWITNPIHMTKQKVHFHKFMLECVHREMHHIKQSSPQLDADEVMELVVKNILIRGQIICFDEFQVTDVADALILRRLFTGLLEAGAVLVITSNRPPDDLYLGGIQRDLFLPFIELIKTQLRVVSMWDSETDYRLVAARHRARGVYFVGSQGRPRFDATFQDLTKRGIVTRNTYVETSNGRKVFVPCASLEYRVAKFSFDDLCRKPLGAADYLAIGENFHTVFIHDVPRLSSHEFNLVRRLITFVDSMYECHVKLIIHAETNPSDIFQVDLKNKASDEAFAFDRTRSRLDEMRSESYLKKKWIGENKHQ